VLVGGESLATGLSLPSSVRELMHAVVRGRVRPYDELKLQVERVAAAGITPTHIDTHKHTHLIPQVLDAVARLAGEYRIRWVRRPFDFPLSGAGGIPWNIQLVSFLMRGLRTRFHRVLSQHGCRTTDYFAGFQVTGRLRVQELVSLIRKLPDGVTEFMCHPGLCTDELRNCRTRLKESREEELRALTSSQVRTALEDEGVRLVGYRHLTL
jgi:predicted glycoside hydrolase/deacetylase ChbG (UPF0249 family)